MPNNSTLKMKMLALRFANELIGTIYDKFGEATRMLRGARTAARPG